MQGNDSSAEGSVSLLRAYEVIQEIQAGMTGASTELRSIEVAAAAQGRADLARACLFGHAIEAWMDRAADLSTAVARLVERSEADGDRAMTALGLALRSAVVNADDDPAAAASGETDLVRAAVLLETSQDDVFARISAHTACGIAFGGNGLWELGDEQYALGLEIGEVAGPAELGALLAPIAYNRAEVQVAWASMLYQVRDLAGLRERVVALEAIWTAIEVITMPDGWRSELDALRLLLSAMVGSDVSPDAKAALAPLSIDDPHQLRTIGHLRLAVAVSGSRARHPAARAAAEAAIEMIDRVAHPHEYDLALYVAAEVEAAEGHPAGLRCAQRQLNAYWSRRLATVASMRARLRDERRAEEYAVLTEHAHLDDLTKVANRRGLARYLSDLDRRGIGMLAVIAIDVDDFKSVNDSYGHRAGDEVLVSVASALATNVRADDLAVRLGGDEFALLLADTDPETASRRAEEVRELLGGLRWPHLDGSLQVTVSVGSAIGDLANVGSVSARADGALYRAKSRGGNALSVDGSATTATHLPQPAEPAVVQ